MAAKKPKLKNDEINNDVVEPSIIPLIRKNNSDHHIAIGVLDSGIEDPKDATVVCIRLLPTGAVKTTRFEKVKVKKIHGSNMIAIIAKRIARGGPISEDDGGVGTLIVTVIPPSPGPPVPITVVGTVGEGEPLP
jgi:hypothetical protein